MLRRRLARPTSTKTSKTSSCFVTPYRGLFVQEEPDVAAGSRGGIIGQHPDFGARVPWSFILDLADGKLGGGGGEAEERRGSKDSSGTTTPSPCPGCFLVYAIRHGRAVSNAVQQFVGDDAWNSGVGQACSFVGDVPELEGESPGGGGKRGEENASWPLFDAPLSSKGREQASSLGELLSGGGWAKRLIGEDDPGENAVVVASPLSRTLDTALLALGPAFFSNSSLVDFHVSEWARETTGVNTCDARRGVSVAASSSSLSEEEEGSQLQSRGRRRRRRRCSCSYDKGLRELYPSSSSSSPPSSSFDGFPVVGRGEAPWSPKEGGGTPPFSSPLPSSSLSPPPLPGLFSKEDEIWDPETRESAESVRERTQVFLEVAAELASRGKKRGEENRRRRVFVVAHSGWIEQLLVGVGRKGFVPGNADLVPLLVQRKEGKECRDVAAAAADAGAAGGLLEEE